MDILRNLIRGRKKPSDSSDDELEKPTPGLSRQGQQRQWLMQEQGKKMLLEQYEHEMNKRLPADELEEKIWGEYMSQFYPSPLSKSYFMPPHFLICDPVHGLVPAPPRELNWYEQEQRELKERRRQKKLRREERKKNLKAGEKLPRRPRHKKSDPPPRPSRIFGDVLTGGGVSSLEQMLEEERDRQRTLAAINKTVTVVEQPMTVLSQLWFRKHLDMEEVNPDRLVNPLYFTAFNLRNYLDPLPEKLRDGEGDLVFFHRHRGVLIGEMILGEALGEEDRREKEKRDKEREEREKEEREREEREKEREKEEREKEEKEREEREKSDSATGGVDGQPEGGAEAEKKTDDDHNDDNMEVDEREEEEEKKKKKKKKKEKKEKKEKEEENEEKKTEGAEKMEEAKEKERYKPKDEAELVKRIEQALLQIQNQEKAFVHLISDLLPPSKTSKVAKGVPHITRMLFLPSICRDRLELALSSSNKVVKLAVKILAGGDRRKLPQLFVCDEDMDVTDGSQPPWFFQHYPGDTSNVDIEENLYKKLMTRFLGPACTVDLMTHCPSATEVKRLGKMLWPTYSRFVLPYNPHADSEQTAENENAMDVAALGNDLPTSQAAEKTTKAEKSSKSKQHNPKAPVKFWKPPPLPPPVPDDPEDDDDDDRHHYYYHRDYIHELFFLLDHGYHDHPRLRRGFPIPDHVDLTNEEQVKAYREKLTKEHREWEKKMSKRRRREEAKRKREEAMYTTVDHAYLPRAPKPRQRSLDFRRGESPLQVSSIPLTPTQMSVLSELPAPKYLYVQGPPGCGKSVVLLCKALAWTRQGKPVVLVVQGEANAAAMALLERQLIDMLGVKANLVRLYDIEFEPAIKVRSEVARIWRQHGPEAMIVMEGTPWNNTKELISWLVEIRKTGPDSRVYLADDIKRDREQHESLRLPKWFECRDVREFRRYPRKIALMVQSKFRYGRMQFKTQLQGLLTSPVLTHRGLHNTALSEDCHHCAHNIAMMFNYLKVGQPGGELEYRDVLIILSSLNEVREQYLLTTLRDTFGFPLVRIRGSPLKDGEAQELALGLSDQIIMTGVPLIHGIGRKVVVCCDPSKMHDRAYITHAYQAMARAHFLLPCVD